MHCWAFFSTAEVFLDHDRSADIIDGFYIEREKRQLVIEEKSVHVMKEDIVGEK